MGNIVTGIKLDLSVLSESDKKKLLKVMARMSEASYRRGLQQGAGFQEDRQFKKDPGDWRYMTSLDYSPLGDTGVYHRNKKASFNYTLSMTRLDVEYGLLLKEIGLNSMPSNKP